MNASLKYFVPPVVDGFVDERQPAAEFPQSEAAGTLASPADAQLDQQLVVASPADSPAQALDALVSSYRRSKSWFVVARPSLGESLVADTEDYVGAFRTAVLHEVLKRGDSVDIHRKAADGKWSTTTMRFEQFAKSHFDLRILFEPVWGHALAGLKWGALAGIGLKMLDTTIALAAADPMMALLFIGAVVVCCIPRLGVLGIIVISVGMAQFSHANFFMMAMGAAAVGAALGCLPGMAIGGLVGLSRQSNLPRAPEATPESGGTAVRAVLLPALGAAALLVLYVCVFNPWAVSFVTKQ